MSKRKHYQRRSFFAMHEKIEDTSVAGRNPSTTVSQTYPPRNTKCKWFVPHKHGCPGVNKRSNDDTEHHTLSLWMDANNNTRDIYVLFSDVICFNIRKCRHSRRWTERKGSMGRRHLDRVHTALLAECRSGITTTRKHSAKKKSNQLSISRDTGARK